MSNLSYWSESVKEKSSAHAFDFSRPTSVINQPLEELTFRLDNVLDLTDSFKIICYHNSIKLKCVHSNPSNPCNVENVDRTIHGFSANSRRNMKKKLSTIRFDLYPERFFVTLTFGKVFEKDHVKLKRQVDNFNKVLNRFGNNISFIWKLELQKRGAPHLHYIILFRDHLSYKRRNALAHRIREAWHRSLVYKDSFTFACSVHVEEIRDTKKTINYIVKYMNKLDESPDDVHLGRRWATSNNLINQAHFICRVDEKFYYRFKERLLFLLSNKYNMSPHDVEKIGMNSSFQMSIWWQDAESLVRTLCDDMKRTFITHQLNNSPPDFIPEC